MNVAEVRGGRRRSPADGMGIKRTAGQHVRCSMTGVEAANIPSQNTSTWDYQVKLNRSGSHVRTSMCLMFECTSLCGDLGCSGHTESFVEHLQELLLTVGIPLLAMLPT